MRGLLIALLLLVAAPAMAQVASQPGPGPCPFGASSCQTTATGSTTPRTLAARAADVVNIVDFGAKCDGTTDDTAAINAAFAVVRARSVNYGPGSSPGPYSKIVFPTSAGCRINSAVNATMLTGFSVFIEGAGATILCHSTGAICLDGLGSRWLHWSNLTVVGDSVDVPLNGIQIGRTNTTALSDADRNVFSNVIITGDFTRAGLYNVASETSLFEGVSIYNHYSSATAYCLIQDGQNHWNSSSTFVTQSAPVDGTLSFDENTFVSLDVRNTGGGPTIWIANTNKTQFIGSYSATVSGTTGAVIWAGATGGNNNLYFDMHFEATSLENVFLISGTNATPVIFGLTYHDNGSTATNSIFKADTGITGVVMRNADLFIGSYVSTSVKLFDDATIWTVTGDYRSATIDQFSVTPKLWQGTLSIGQARTLAAYGAHTYLSAQMPDSTTIGGNARGDQSVDWQQTRASASFAATGAQSTITGGINNSTSGFASTAGGNGNAVTSTAGTAFGQQNTITGPFSSSPGGKGCLDRARSGNLCWSSSFIAAQGDAQLTSNTMWQTTSAASAVRLTTTGAVAAATNCITIPNNTAYGVHISLHGRNNSTPGTDYDWVLPNGMLTRDANAASTLWSQGTPVTLTRGTVTGVAVSVTADTTIGCLNVSFTPPTGNTDTWHIVARVDTTEVQ
jgi:hypothetical protein